MAEDTAQEQTDSKNTRLKKISALAVGVFLLLLIAYPSFVPKIKLAYFQATGKGDEIFQNYYNTRPRNALTAETSYDTATGAVSFAPNYYSIYPELSDIIVTKTQTKAGPKVSICQEYGTHYLQFNGDQRNEYAYYQDLYKSVLTTAQGEIIELFLTNKDGSYEYRGGSYAILRELSKEENLLNSPLETITDEQSAPSSGYEGPDSSDTVVVPSDDTVSDIVIDDVVNSPDTYNLVAVDRINGKDYLVYEYTYEHFCTSDNNPQPQPIPAIQKTWIDPDTYMTVKDELYLEKVNDSNKVYTTTSTVQYLDPSLKDTYFAFDVQTETRTIQFLSDEDIFNEWLSTTTANALIPTDENSWTVAGISSSEAYDSFYTRQNAYMSDRAFYLPGPVGDYYFSLQNGMLDTPPGTVPSSRISDETPTSKLDVNAYSQTGNASLYTAMFSGAIDEEMFQRYQGLSNEYRVGPVTLTINGARVTATQYTTTTEDIYEPETREGSIGSDVSDYDGVPPRTNSYTSYYYYLVYQDNTYYITLGGDANTLSDLSSQNLAFTNLSTENPQDLERIKQLHSPIQMYPQPMPLIDSSR